jgi:hypothetical protein
MGTNVKDRLYIGDVERDETMSPLPPLTCDNHPHTI